MNYQKYYKQVLLKEKNASLPTWLRKQAQEEIYYVMQMAQARTWYDIKDQHRILDLGSGDLRITKHLNQLPTWEQVAVYGCDLFTVEAMRHHLYWDTVIDLEKYKQLEKHNGLYYIPDFQVKFDVIVCFGVDYILEEKQVRSYIEQCAFLLKSDGILIWQINRNDTPLGKKLAEHDKHLNCKYRPITWYADTFGLDDHRSTQISHILQFR